jgi:plastocyanin
MRKISIIILMLAALAMPSFDGVSAASVLAQTLKGRILLQVESQGQAWYIDPITLNRAFLGRPADAFNIMRSFGLGISNANLAKIAEAGKADVDRAFARRYSGRILLQVQSHGEAWYVNPVNLKRYFLGRPADAFRIMRELGLGISNADLRQITVDSRFPETPAAPAPAPAPVPAVKTHNLSMQNFTFNPSSITINRGDTLVWTNMDAINHTVTSSTSTPLSGFGSDMIAPSQSYRFTFTQPGTFQYHCSIHLTMTGTIIVR